MSLVQPTARIVSAGAGIVILVVLALKYFGGCAVPQDTVVLPLLVVLLLGLVLSTVARRDRKAAWRRSASP